jgi:hypothetical protein
MVLSSGFKVTGSREFSTVAIFMQTPKIWVAYECTPVLPSFLKQV